MSSTTSFVSLGIFMGATLIEVDGMIIDLLLRLAERPTITDYIRHHWWAGVPIISLHIIGVVALCIHFWFSGSGPEMNGPNPEINKPDPTVKKVANIRPTHKF